MLIQFKTFSAIFHFLAHKYLAEKNYKILTFEIFEFFLEYASGPIVRFGNHKVCFNYQLHSLSRAHTLILYLQLQAWCPIKITDLIKYCFLKYLLTDSMFQVHVQ